MNKPHQTIFIIYDEHGACREEWDTYVSTADVLPGCTIAQYELVKTRDVTEPLDEDVHEL